MKAPAKGVLRIGPAQVGKAINDKLAPAVSWWVNGRPVVPGDKPLEIPLDAGETAVISIVATAEVNCPVEWKP